MKKTETLILMEQFCTSHEIEISFILALHNFGLMEIIVVEEKQYLSLLQVKDAEKMIRLHYELDVNLEGIDIINNLLLRIENMQAALTATQNKLRLIS